MSNSHLVLISKKFSLLFGTIAFFGAGEHRCSHIQKPLLVLGSKSCNQVSSVIIILSSYFCPPTLNFCKKCFTCLHPLFLWLSDKSFGPHLVHTQLITMFIVRIVKMNNLLNLHEDENYLKVRCLSFMTLSWIQHFVFSHIAMVFHFLQHLLN